MKHKIVINVAYGGFDLSITALDWFKKNGIDDPWQLPRHHPLLIRCIEELGIEQVGGRFSSLKIEEIEGPFYRIEEYDGLETLETPDSLDWIYIEENPA